MNVRKLWWSLNAAALLCLASEGRGMAVAFTAPANADSVGHQFGALFTTAVAPLKVAFCKDVGEDCYNDCCEGLVCEDDGDGRGTVCH